MASPAVFLDRDGVINRTVIHDGKPYPPASLDQLEIIPGVTYSLNELASAGFLLIVVTNQPDVARGAQSKDTVEAINAHIKNALPVTAVYTCYHDDADNCACRKPKSGLIEEAVLDYAIDLSKSWMVGDRWKDISAGKKAGLKTVFVEYHYNEIYSGPDAEFVIGDLSALSSIILNNINK